MERLIRLPVVIKGFITLFELLSHDKGKSRGRSGCSSRARDQNVVRNLQETILKFLGVPSLEHMREKERNPLLPSVQLVGGTQLDRDGFDTENLNAQTNRPLVMENISSGSSELPAEMLLDLKRISVGSSPRKAPRTSREGRASCGRASRDGASVDSLTGATSTLGGDVKPHLALPEERLDDIYGSLHANHLQVLNAVQQSKGGKVWLKAGKAGAADCFVHHKNGELGVVSIMGRVKVLASRERILSALADPNSGIQERTIIESLGTIPCDEEGVVGGRIDLNWIGCDMPVISNRDFCVASIVRLEPHLDESQVQSSAVLGTVSVTIPTCQNRQHYTRGCLKMSGWHVKPLGPDACGVTYVSMTKLEAKLPSFALKLGNKKGGESALRLKKLVESSESLC